ncbi:hypothetical protein L1887_17787 [Cichorium endivia]|nr:hypothetical protein L1887_17787 [Cichorium endivia]
MDKKLEDLNSCTLGDGEILNIHDCALFQQQENDLEPYVGKVTRIRKNGLETEVFVKWYYWPYETKYGHLEFQGKQEVLSSDRKTWEDRDSILRKCKVYEMDEYLQLNEADVDEFFCSSKHCKLCIWPYNPDVPMIRCDKYLWW